MLTIKVTFLETCKSRTNSFTQGRLENNMVALINRIPVSQLHGQIIRTITMVLNNETHHCAMITQL